MGAESAQDIVRTKGLEIFRLIGAETPALFDRGWWAGRMMERVMREPSLKVPLFRFVDVLPALNDSRQIARHAREYFTDGTSPRPWIVSFLPSTYLVKKGVTRVSRTFIAGETPRSALKNLRRLWDEGKPFTVDILGEAVVSEAEADRYRDLYLRLVDTLKVPRERYEFQMLYGMGEPIKRALMKMGFRVREYAPIGELLPGMAYLVRRLLENSSNEGFLQRAFLGHASPEDLLAEPERYVEAPYEREVAGSVPFSNEPAADFAIRETRTAFRNALTEAGNRMSESYPAVIDGKEYRQGEPIVSVDPARPREVVGTVSGITRELADHAVQAARAAQG
jgi:hypothetical protein